MLHKLFKPVKQKYIKLLGIYISDKNQQIIFAPYHQNDAGVYYEQEQCFCYDWPLTEQELGKHTITYWNQFSPQDKNLRDQKGTDWPAFKWSKTKTIRSFKTDYIKIAVSGANPSNITLNIQGAPYEESELFAASSISVYTDEAELGQRVLQIFQACITSKLF